MKGKYYGIAQIRYGGSIHLIDAKGETFCGTKSHEDRLFDDGSDLKKVNCKRCIKGLNK